MKTTSITSKNEMLTLLLDIAKDDDDDSGVRPADKISAIKQICLMEGYNLPIKKEVTKKTYTLNF